MKIGTARKLVPFAIVLTMQLTYGPLTAHGEPPHVSATVGDVALQSGGVLTGRLVDPNGAAVPHAQVWVQSRGKWVATVVTDESGGFRAEGLDGGLVYLLAGQGAAAYRAWAPGTAPPGASQSAVMVAQGPVYRGQRPISELFFADPVVVGLVVAAAIAIPISVHNSKKSRAPGS